MLLKVGNLGNLLLVLVAQKLTVTRTSRIRAIYIEFPGFYIRQKHLESWKVLLAENAVILPEKALLRSHVD